MPGNVVQRPQHRPPLWKRRFYVHALQKKYAIYVGAYLFSYSVLIFGLAFAVPHMISAVKMYLPLPIEERAMAASQFLALAQSLGPALIALMVGSGFFSIYLTHKVAGPLYRLEKYAAAMAQGDLSQRLQLRAGDELHELVEFLNSAVARMDGALREIDDHTLAHHAIVAKLLDRLRRDPSSRADVLRLLENLSKEDEQIRLLLRTFQLSKPS
jgi:methyl-accepting chemotaxis protein